MNFNCIFSSKVPSKSGDEQENETDFLGPWSVVEYTNLSSNSEKLQTLELYYFYQNKWK